MYISTNIYNWNITSLLRGLYQLYQLKTVTWFCLLLNLLFCETDNIWRLYQYILLLYKGNILLKIIFCSWILSRLLKRKLKGDFGRCFVSLKIFCLETIKTWFTRIFRAKTMQFFRTNYWYCLVLHKFSSYTKCLIIFKLLLLN